jgi:hypothetical protein
MAVSRIHIFLSSTEVSGQDCRLLANPETARVAGTMGAVGFCGALTGLMFQIQPFDLLGQERPGRPGQGSRVGIGIGIGIGISGAGELDLG